MVRRCNCNVYVLHMFFMLLKFTKYPTHHFAAANNSCNQEEQVTIFKWRASDSKNLNRNKLIIFNYLIKSFNPSLIWTHITFMLWNLQGNCPFWLSIILSYGILRCIRAERKLLSNSFSKQKLFLFAFSLYTLYLVPAHLSHRPKLELKCHIGLQESTFNSVSHAYILN